MFSGKTTELLRLLNLAVIANLKVKLFKPKIDNRYDEKKVVSHDNRKMEAIVVEKSENVLEHTSENLDIVGIDEVQFFDRDIVRVVDKLLDKKLAVVVAGLNLDFKGDPFGQMPTLLAKADNLVKVYAVCSKCKNPATRTQRLIDGIPAKRNSPIILVGGKDQYTARCVNCHEVSP
jgi:thymidine kinase